MTNLDRGVCTGCGLPFTSGDGAYGRFNIPGEYHKRCLPLRPDRHPVIIAARNAALEEIATLANERGRLALATSATMPDGILKEREAAAGAELIGFASAIRALKGEG
jgi:hypothetical protein